MGVSAFDFIADERWVVKDNAKLLKIESKTKENRFFFCRDVLTSRCIREVK